MYAASLRWLPGLNVLQSDDASEPEGTAVYADPDVPSDSLVSERFVLWVMQFLTHCVDNIFTDVSLPNSYLSS